MSSAEKLFLRVLRGGVGTPPPIWLMRQAGRYLPEYRAARARAGDFLTTCLTPEIAVELTLQPIRRYRFDAAILFSDILVVPHGLGQSVRFEEGRGPVLAALDRSADLSKLSATGIGVRLAPIYEAVRRLRAELPTRTALVGFAGAPWTVASYMIEGGTSKDFSKAKAWAYAEPESFQRLIDLLIDVTCDHLIAQIEAGAEAIQLFDSWAGVWPEAALRRWCLHPAATIRARLRAAHPTVPVIHFPRGVGALYPMFAEEVGAEALSLDTTIPLAWARANLQTKVVVQGNLDPIALLAGGTALQESARRILDALGHGAFVFNLGHGVVPETPPEHVQALVEQVRAWRP